MHSEWGGRARSRDCVLGSPSDLAWADLADPAVTLTDLMSEACYERSGEELRTRGLYLDLPAWRYHVFDCRTRRSLLVTPG